MPPKELTFPGSRVKLISPPPLDDDVEVAALYSSPIAAKHLGIPIRQHSVEEVKARREHRANNPANVDFAIHLVKPSSSSDKSDSTTTFVGVCNLTVQPMNMTAQAGIILNPKYMGGGYASEALFLLLDYGFSNKMEMRKIVFETSETNDGMRGWCRTVLGVDLEYRQKSVFMGSDGDWVDACGYGLLKEEWVNSKRETLEKRVKAKAQKQNKV